MPNVLWIQDTRPLAYSIVRPTGAIYNFTTGAWEVVATTGIPTVDQRKALDKLHAAGLPTSLLKNQQVKTLPDIVASEDGIALVIWSTDVAGVPIEQIDVWPAAYLNYTAGCRGGVTRR